VSGGRLAAALAAGSRGWIHARDIDTDREVGLDPDARVCISSIVKLALLVAMHRLVDVGELDLTAPREIAVAGRTSGFTGLSVFQDPVAISLRDLATLMITVSDNAAADVIFDAVGVRRVQAEMSAIGCAGIKVRERIGDMFAALRAETGGVGPAGVAGRVTDPEAVARWRVLDPGRSSSASPRDLTGLLAGIWRDEVASSSACADMRRALGLQVWPHRLVSGFPGDDIRVSGKTATLATLRHEIGVVEYPDGGRYAVAVLTRTGSLAPTQPRADAAIGTAARTAVELLRSGPTAP
jgi:beta-lactamase class A